MQPRVVGSNPPSCGRMLPAPLSACADSSSARAPPLWTGPVLRSHLAELARLALALKAPAKPLREILFWKRPATSLGLATLWQVHATSRAVSYCISPWLIVSPCISLDLLVPPCISLLTSPTSLSAAARALPPVHPRLRAALPPRAPRLHLPLRPPVAHAAPPAALLAPVRDPHRASTPRLPRPLLSRCVPDRIPACDPRLRPLSSYLQRRLKPADGRTSECRMLSQASASSHPSTHRTAAPGAAPPGGPSPTRGFSHARWRRSALRPHRLA